MNSALMNYIETVDRMIDTINDSIKDLQERVKRLEIKALSESMREIKALSESASSSSGSLTEMVDELFYPLGRPSNRE